MHRINRRAALATMSGLALAACTSPSPTPKFPDITFTHLPPLRLDAASLAVVDAFKPSFAARHIEHLLPVSPAAAVRRWAQDRLLPVGNAGRIVFTISDAGVIEIPLERTKGVRGVVTKDRSERYDASLRVHMSIDAGDGRRRGEVSADAMRSRTVLEGLSLNEREEIWFRMIEELVGDINGELESAILEFLQPFLVSRS
ncbi:MAG: hypothetical protein CL573_03895 [Alphaproteobacteria bacterium]|nr:hypothetical protein [Alphaproteobacteria bacterium]HCP01822.1 hypothetical protein [Rhodospirillaceae bacterium]